MSHWATIKTEVRDLAAVHAAAVEMALTLQVAQPGQKVKARGYYATKDCDAVLKLKGPYDVALDRQPDGTYTLTTDWYGGAEKEVGKGFQKLIQLYGVNKATLEARRRGLLVQRQAGQNGAINLVLSGGAL